MYSNVCWRNSCTVARKERKINEINGDRHRKTRNREKQCQWSREINSGRHRKMRNREKQCQWSREISNGRHNKIAKFIKTMPER